MVAHSDIPNIENRDHVRGLEGLRILLVEDMGVVAETMCWLLREFGCEVVGPAARLADAVRAAQNEEVDGALLDINLNGQMVFPAADELIAKGIPFIFLTGYGRSIVEPPYDREAMIEKPFSKADLKEVMMRVFGGVGVGG